MRPTHMSKENEEFLKRMDGKNWPNRLGAHYEIHSPEEKARIQAISDATWEHKDSLKKILKRRGIGPVERKPTYPSNPIMAIFTEWDYQRKEIAILDAMDAHAEKAVENFKKGVELVPWHEEDCSRRTDADDGAVLL